MRRVVHVIESTPVLDPTALQTIDDVATALGIDVALLDADFGVEQMSRGGAPIAVVRLEATTVRRLHGDDVAATRDDGTDDVRVGLVH